MVNRTVKVNIFNINLFHGNVSHGSTSRMDPTYRHANPQWVMFGL
jgi:hypothetical protein